MASKKNLKPSLRPKQKPVVHRTCKKPDLSNEIAEASDKFLRVLHHLPAAPPAPGKIRFLSIPWHRVCATDPFYIALAAKDRSFREWHALAATWNAEISRLPSDICTKPFYFHRILHNPFLNRHLYGAALERLLVDEMRLRWWARKWMARLRWSIYARKRCVGATEDLYTCQPVPTGQAVRILDVGSRSLYVFHTSTALKLLLSALHYCQYGIACPTPPKNPYTNLPWSYGQLHSLVAQIGHILWSRHHPFPAALLLFREVDYDVKRFATVNRRDLAIRAAETFFKEPEARETYNELMCDLYESVYADEPPTEARRVRIAVVNRRITPALQDRWDTCIVSAWIYENHNFLHGGFETYEQMLGTFLLLHTMTVDALRRQTLGPTHTLPSPVTAALANAILLGGASST